jgi:hypothetical protein
MPRCAESGATNSSPVLGGSRSSGGIVAREGELDSFRAFALGDKSRSLAASACVSVLEASCKDPQISV